MYKIRIFRSQKRNYCFDLKLFPRQKLNNQTKANYIEPISLLSDQNYFCTLLDDNGNEIKNTPVSMNGEVLHNGKIANYLLENALGLVSFSIRDRKYISKFVPVWIKDNEKNRKEQKNISSILDYFYDNLEVINFKETIDSRLQLLEEIIDHYEKSYPYFVKQYHSVFVKQEQVGNIEKLKAISFKTVKYMATHPQYMLPNGTTKSSNGKYNLQKNSPYKTLVNLGQNSLDTYENRTIVAFLNYLMVNLEHMNRRVDRAVKRYEINPKEMKPGYQFGPDILNKRHRDKVKEYQQKSLTEYRKKIVKLLHDYETLFGFKTDSLKTYPRFTPVFQSFPQYRLIYRDINRWFDLGEYDPYRDMNLYFFTYAHEAYEKYCLINLIKEIPRYQYKLTNKSILKYHVEGYDEREYNVPYPNYFKFQNVRSASCAIEVYYQAVVPEAFGSAGDFGESTLKLLKKPEASTDSSQCQGRPYWLPDFVIRIKKDGKNYYLICDAKYSSESTARKFRLDELVSKYVTQMRLQNKEHDKHIGVMAFYGKVTDVPPEISGNSELLYFQGSVSAKYNSFYDKETKESSESVSIETNDKQEGLIVPLSSVTPYEKELHFILEKIIDDPMHVFAFDPDVHSRLNYM